MKTFLAITALALIFIAPLSAQEFAYVTDSLQLRVHASASASSDVLQSIDSGDSVEVFESENGFSKVSTYDGTVGWVKSAFLVAEPPDKLLYYSVGEKNKELEAQIEELKNGLQSTSPASSSEADVNKIKELQSQLEQQQQSNQKLQKQLDESSEIAQVTTSTLSTSTLDKAQQEIPATNKTWLLIGSATLLLVGLLLGVKISTWRMRKRLHGFSI